jgi:hypothetical protein
MQPFQESYYGRILWSSIRAKEEKIVEILDNIPVDVDVNALLTCAHISPESRVGQELQTLIDSI